MGKTTLKAWKIDADMQFFAPGGEYDHKGTWGNENGACLIRNGKVKCVTHKGESICSVNDADLDTRFRITDDDGEIYYEGRMTHALADAHDILRPLDDFATPNDGATTLQLWSNVKNDWESVN